MYTRMITTRIKPGGMEGAIAIYEEQIVPVLRKQPGFRGATLLVNEETATAVSMTCWATREQLLASEASGHLQDALSEMALYLNSTPLNDHYTIRLQVGIPGQ